MSAPVASPIPLRQTLIDLLKAVVNVLRLSVGLAVYLVTRRTPQFGYQGLVGLFCATGGAINDLLSPRGGGWRRRSLLPPATGALGDCRGARMERIQSDLRRHGYHQFDALLPEQLCAALFDHALTRECLLRPFTSTGGAKPEVTFYDRAAPRGVRYDFRERDLLAIPAVQQLIADPSILAVAQDYLGATPILDIVTMWWHTAFSKEANVDAAQLFHFDLDRIRWLKFFFYLTDVGLDNGPHVFVPGSHRRGGIPRHLLRKGYARLSDAEVEAHYGRQGIHQFVAPRGTIIVEDTRGLHKGQHVVHGDRLVFQLEFCTSLFGASDRRGAGLEAVVPELQAMIRLAPRIYSNYRA